MKTCQKLGISFYHFLGDRLGLGRLRTANSTFVATRHDGELKSGLSRKRHQLAALPLVRPLFLSQQLR